MQKANTLQVDFQINQHQTKKNSRNTNMDRIRKSLKVLPIINERQCHFKSRLSIEQSCQSIDSQDQEISFSSRSYYPSSAYLICDGFEEKYALMEKLGEGSSGVVHRCCKIKTNQQYAVKSFTFEDEHLPSIRSNFMILKNLDHPHIATYEALYIDLRKRIGYLVMELVKAPSLHKVEISSEDELREVMQQLLETLNYLHHREIAHRDIKLENVLYDQSTKQIKLIDFGVCRRFKKRGALFDMWTITGTLYYRAPEMFLGGGYREKVDIWAAGVLLYKLVAKKTPFESEYHSQTVNRIITKEVEFPPQFDNFSFPLHALISRMLKKNPQQRMKAIDCLKDIWFFGIASHLQQHIGSMMVIPDQDCLNATKEGAKSSLIKKMHCFRCVNSQQYQYIQSLSSSQDFSGKKRNIESKPQLIENDVLTFEEQ